MDSKDTNSTAVRFESLTVKYSEKIALDNLCLEIPQGSVYALLGRNGAGKSSAIRCLLGIQKPTHGFTSINGIKSWENRSQIMQRVGVVPEDPNAPFEMSPNELAAFCSNIYPKWSMDIVSNRFKRFEIPINTPFKSLSKGQKEHVMLVLALGHSPDILILDDPTLGLDVVARNHFFDELIVELADRGTTVLITTHDLLGIEKIVDNVGILNRGHLLINDSLEILKSKYRRINFLNSPIEKIESLQDSLKQFELVKFKQNSWGVEAIISNYDPLATEKILTSTINTNTEISTLSLEDIFSIVCEKPEGEIL